MLPRNRLDPTFLGGPGLGVKFTLAEKLLLSKIHAKLGLDRCLHGMGSGAAPLSIETIEFLKSIGVIYFQLNQSFDPFLFIFWEIFEA